MRHFSLTYKQKIIEFQIVSDNEIIVRHFNGNGDLRNCYMIDNISIARKDWKGLLLTGWERI